MGLLKKLLRVADPTPQHGPDRATSPTVTLDGDGSFRVQVVGESRYRESFARIFGPRTPDGVDEERDASLVLDDDNAFDDHAVRVEIEGLPVGYLARGDARAYRRWLEAHGHGRARCQCSALIRGGWDRGAGDRGDYGVSLDLAAEVVGVGRRSVQRDPQLDEHGQPNQWFNLSRRIDRSVHELLGLAKGIVADGRVSTDETQLLRTWMAVNAEAASAWPGNVLADRLDRIFADGHADETEREDLRRLLEDLAGGGTEEAGNPTTRLPLDDPPPALEFDGSVYVFTGRFFSGTPRWCEYRVEAQGATCSSSVTRRTNYLVIGELGSRDWKHTSFGRKVQKAVEVRSDGYPLAIVAEDHWAARL